MKHVIIALVLLIFTSGNIPNNKSNANIEVNTKLIRSYDSSYDIKIEIYNKTNKQTAFWLMTCSWNRNFVINNDYFEFGAWPCDSNYPHLVRIKPKCILTLNCTLHKSKNNNFSGPRITRLGLIYVDSLKCSNFREYRIFMRDNKEKQIIWSNSLILK